MTYQYNDIQKAYDILIARSIDIQNPSDILKATELKALYTRIASLPHDERAVFGKELNQLKDELVQRVRDSSDTTSVLRAIDVTAPFDSNTEGTISTNIQPSDGSIHPLMTELQKVLDIFYRMGFEAIESREIDDDYHMFSALNFPEDHPARDDYDTFMTIQTDNKGKQFIAPAHTSTMQNRAMKARKDNLEKGEPIAVVIPGRVFRNEDLDARHEHTFYQLEGVYVGQGIHVGNLMATLKTFLQEYYGRELEIKTQPFYFPFTEPSFEFALSCPFCNKEGCKVCGEGWIELLGCGMIHPNVLREAGIDPDIYTGFAWGGGIDRLVMMKYDIEDIRHFESGRLEF